MGIKSNGSEWVRSCFKRYGMQVRVAAAVLAVITAVPLAARADWHTFEAGAKIVASEVNDNFQNLAVRLESFESNIFIDDATGNVGIGTASPGAPFDIHSSAFGAPHLRFSYNSDIYHDIVTYWHGGTPAKNFLQFKVYDGSGGKGTQSTVMTLNGASNVGIKTTSPDYPLDVNGEIRAVKVTQTSDVRLKRDIRPITHALEGIQCLQGVTYFLRDPLADQGLQYGLIAQEVERCYPELVSTDSDGYKSVSYDRLVAPLIEAVKEQQAIIADQTRVNAEQELMIRDLTAKSAATNARLARLEALAE